VWGWQGSWLGLAAAALLLSLGTWRWLPREGTTSDRPATAGAAPVGGRRLLSWLTAAYFLEGLGYVVTGTFLVAQVQRLPGLAGYGASAWVLVGLAAVPSCVLWAHLARRAGYPTALTLAYGVQAAGIVLPVVWPSLIGIYSGAIFFGGTFMGIVTLTIGWGRTLLPQQSGWVIGLLTTAFGAGQILGPGAAGWLAERLDGFAIPLIAAALVVAAGGLLIPLGLWFETRKR
ncbi:MAG: YbfB/YjiJ family MFS transporter, partial [Desulfuromonadales bacterium]|nr:YbfB/YjiJ family MFS transporter [Desulfuromonadales bacterium]